MIEPTPHAANVLVVEDDPSMQRFLRAALRGAGYRIEESPTVDDALQRVATRAPDLVILDLGLPDGDGLTVLETVRSWSALPVIVVTARGGEDDKIAALDAGADDYVTKPFAVGELLARVRAALRRSTRLVEDGRRTLLEAGALRIDMERRRVTVDERDVHLSPIEFKLLAVLARHAGRVCTHTQLLREVWGPGATGRPHYLRVYVGALRHKIERDPLRPQLLFTEPGVGYRLRDLDG